MGEPQPYRLSARATPAREAVPTTLVLALQLGMGGFAAGAVMWVVLRGVFALNPISRRAIVATSVYEWMVDGVFVVVTALGAWRPLPKTRGQWFARVALVASLVALVSEHWPIGFGSKSCVEVESWAGTSPVTMLVRVAARMVLAMAVAGFLLEAGRRFVLLRWPAVVAAAFGAALAEPNLDQVLHVADGRPFLLPTFMGAFRELGMLVAFAGAFWVAARGVRRKSFVDEEAILAGTAPRRPKSDLPILDAWAAASRVVLAATFALAALAIGRLRVFAMFANERSAGTVVFGLGLIAMLVVVEIGRRQHRAVSSTALTVAAGFAVLTQALALCSHGRAGLGFQEIATFTGAFVLGGLVVLLPTIATPASLGHRVKKARLALVVGALSVGLSAVTRLEALSAADACPPASGRGSTVLLWVGFALVTLAAHLLGSVERAAVIEKALAAAEEEGER